MSKRLLKLANKKPIIKVGLISLLAIVVFVVIAGFKVQADNVVFGFKAHGTIVPGDIVALSRAEPNTVELAPANDPGRIYGVAIDPKQAAITVQSSDSKVYVATSGSYQVLASATGGDIKTGDYISMSTQDGVAGKATDRSPFILGRALSDFGQDKNGSLVGKAIVEISPGANPFLKNDIGVPKFLRRLTEAVSGKPLSGIRIYGALAMFTVGVATCAGLLAVGVKGGMIAIGRNPLSRHSVLQSLGQVSIVAVAIFIVSLFGIYLLLKA